jgi:hypothetical protein
MVEVKLCSEKSMEQRVADRLKPSCGGDYDVEKTMGSGPTRCVTSIHYGGQVAQHGETNPGEGSITGGKRGVV